MLQDEPDQVVDKRKNDCAYKQSKHRPRNPIDVEHDIESACADSHVDEVLSLKEDENCQDRVYPKQIPSQSEPGYVIVAQTMSNGDRDCINSLFDIFLLILVLLQSSFQLCR